MDKYAIRHYFRLALFTTLLAFFVVMLGAYTRLTDAGLGCPDWPTCYGYLAVPGASTKTSHLIDTVKAWTEMTHRYVAGLLGLMIFALGILAVRNKRYPEQPLVLPIALVCLVVFQAFLGMWTVTLKLFPLVVVAHLLGGLSTLVLLLWLCLKLKPIKLDGKIDKLKSLRILAVLSLLVLILQIFFGGWMSANYAALACVDFPGCQGSLFPSLNFVKAFDLTSAGVIGSLGHPLDNTSRVTIHMGPRMRVLTTAIVISWLAFQVFARAESLVLRCLSVALAVLITMQIMLGVTNVLALLPLPVAIAHSAVAALLLLSLVALNYYLHTFPRHKE